MLGGDITKMSLRFSPGFCDIEHGAVEDIDWRDEERVRWVAALLIGTRNVVCASTLAVLEVHTPCKH